MSIYLCYTVNMIDIKTIDAVKQSYIHARITTATRAMIDALAAERGGNASEVIRDAIALLYRQEQERKEKHEG